VRESNGTIIVIVVTQTKRRKSVRCDDMKSEIIFYCCLCGFDYITIRDVEKIMMQLAVVESSICGPDFKFSCEDFLKVTKQCHPTHTKKPPHPKQKKTDPTIYMISFVLIMSDLVMDNYTALHTPHTPIVFTCNCLCIVAGAH
jgi:hypothetical protein